MIGMISLQFLMTSLDGQNHFSYLSWRGIWCPWHFGIFPSWPPVYLKGDKAQCRWCWVGGNDRSARAAVKSSSVTRSSCFFSHEVAWVRKCLLLALRAWGKGKLLYFTNQLYGGKGVSQKWFLLFSETGVSKDARDSMRKKLGRQKDTPLWKGGADNSLEVPNAMSIPIHDFGIGKLFELCRRLQRAGRSRNTPFPNLSFYLDISWTYLSLQE